VFRRQRASEPAAVFNPSTVDLVASTPDESTVELHIVQTGIWTGSDDQLRSLQEKVHSYVAYAVDGQLVRDFPEVEGRPWQIVLDCQTGEPDPRTSEMLAALVEPLKRYGGELRIATPRP
jgi:uncharacterized protein DUF6572